MKISITNAGEREDKRYFPYQVPNLPRFFYIYILYFFTLVCLFVRLHLVQVNRFERVPYAVEYGRFDSTQLDK